ncbi:aminoglycoside phosphotransferase family protein [Paenibacillus farraposensis]|uniref:Aminoglycoside phosphotransferase family protein n=1 Tax=Paenibacillus farraposensis TaxID=2807095 RepID=A0ABW4D852_9BACL|nr:aminoglycoside phosphotransferase family protein [Paenibacillus farraposensis]MCC3378306.1 aminoglycoside phosphotransferase family protein [Paenibacillus farraposensis]
MDIQLILNELYKAGVLESHMQKLKPLSGGTSSEVVAVMDGTNPRYVIKQNDPAIIEAEAEFLHTYLRIEKLSRLVYVDSLHRYLVYTFKQGITKQYGGTNKADLLVSLATEVIAHYKPLGAERHYGYPDHPFVEWRDLLLHRMKESGKIIQDVLPQEDHHFVHTLVAGLPQRNIKYLLHGDFGVHNFVFAENDTLTGIIDPDPMVGEPLYDLIYAFCSSPDSLTVDTIVPAAEKLGPEMTRESELNREVLQGLYFRIATCIRHHPEDLDQNIEAWTYWLNGVR